MGVGVSPAAAGTNADTQATHQSAVIVLFADDERVNETVITDVGGVVTGGESLAVLPALFARVDTQAISTVQTHPDVRRVEYDNRVVAPASHTLQSPSSTDFVPWGIDRIDARRAADGVSDDAEANVTVAVLDTGIDYDHVDLESAVVWGVDVVGPTEYGLDAADDVDGHGTHVAGTIAARENGLGVVGVAPTVELYSIQVLGPSGGTTSDLIQGVDQALKGPDGTIGTDDDADVISTSLGGRFPSAAEREAIQTATDLGVPVVAAAGNTGDGDPTTDDVIYPARYNASIAVGATGISDETPTFSSDGSAVDIVAPGVSTLSTVPGDSYAQFSGTSMATAHATGIVALMIAEDSQDGTRDLRVDQIRAMLGATARDVGPSGPDTFSGHGLVNATGAVDTVRSRPVIVTSHEPAVVGESVELRVVEVATGMPISATLEVEGVVHQVNESVGVTYRSDTAGTVAVTATVPVETGYTYTVGKTLVVSPGDVTGDTVPANDVNLDGQFEDVNGDGTANIVDVQALFANLANPVVQDNPSSFDFNGDGVVNVVDVQRLYAELTAPTTETM